jgi:hypothetical protein
LGRRPRRRWPPLTSAIATDAGGRTLRPPDFALNGSARFRRNRTHTGTVLCVCSWPRLYPLSHTVTPFLTAFMDTMGTPNGFGIGIGYCDGYCYRGGYGYRGSYGGVFAVDMRPEAAPVAGSLAANMVKVEAVTSPVAGARSIAAPLEGRCSLRGVHLYELMAAMPDTISHHANRLLWRQLRSTPFGPFRDWSSRG